MIISELIFKLNELKEKHGDLEVHAACSICSPDGAGLTDLRTDMMHKHITSDEYIFDGNIEEHMEEHETVVDDYEINVLLCFEANY